VALSINRRDPTLHSLFLTHFSFLGSHHFWLTHPQAGAHPAGQTWYVTPQVLGQWVVHFFHFLLLSHGCGAHLRFGTHSRITGSHHPLLHWHPATHSLVHTSGCVSPQIFGQAVPQSVHTLLLSHSLGSHLSQASVVTLKERMHLPTFLHVTLTGQL